MPIVTQEVEHDVLSAAISAVRKHGELARDPVRACAILIRECGEAMNEALLMTSGLIPDGFAWGPNMTHSQVLNRFHDQCIDNLYTELSQVAATAMIIMTHIQEEQELGKLDT